MYRSTAFDIVCATRPGEVTCVKGGETDNPDLALGEVMEVQRALRDETLVHVG